MNLKHDVCLKKKNRRNSHPLRQKTMKFVANFSCGNSIIGEEKALLRGIKYSLSHFVYLHAISVATDQPMKSDVWQKHWKHCFKSSGKSASKAWIGFPSSFTCVHGDH